MQPTPTHCRHCGAVLDALTRQRRTGVCGTAKCRHVASASHEAELKSRLQAQAQTLVQVQLPALARQALGVVWLRANDPEMVAVSAADRAEHRAYLQQVVAGGLVGEPTDETGHGPGHERTHEPTLEPTLEPIDPAAPPPTPAAAQGARLCGQCGGRCCQHGAGSHAFIELDVLQRWQAQHPGSDASDAVASYVAYLPEQHVFGACLYQTQQGCALPRQQRAHICNDYACDALQAAQQAHADGSANAVIALTVHQDRVQRAAVIGADATHALRWSDAAAAAAAPDSN